MLRFKLQLKSLIKRSKKLVIDADVLLPLSKAIFPN